MSAARLLTAEQENAVQSIRAEVLHASTLLDRVHAVLLGTLEVKSHFQLADDEAPIASALAQCGLLEVALLRVLGDIDQGAADRKRMPAAQMMADIRRELDRSAP